MTHSEAASKLVVGLKTLIFTIKEEGINFGSVMRMMTELLSIAPVYNYIAALSESERLVFWGECFDKTFGTDPEAIVVTFGPFKAETVEAITDAAKEGFIDIMEEKLQAAA